jgi:catechol 2,3-dioxygenase-like lactoylglutathione lyase family enzyme
MTPWAWALASASASGTAIASSSSSGRPAAGMALREGAALDQLHGEEVEAGARGVLFDGVQGDDVGVLEAGDDGRLPFEAGPSLRVVRDLGRQHLDRHVSSQAAVVAAIDVTHPAGAELLEDVVVREPGTDQDACLLGCWPPAKSDGLPLTVAVMALSRQCMTATRVDWRSECPCSATDRPSVRRDVAWTGSASEEMPKRCCRRGASRFPSLFE